MGSSFVLAASATWVPVSDILDYPLSVSSVIIRYSHTYYTGWVHFLAEPFGWDQTL